jgi:hypothetical protein
MEYTTMEVFNLVLVFIAFPLATFLAGYFIGERRGLRNYERIANLLWIRLGKRTKLDKKLEDIGIAIEAIQRGSE